LVLNGIRSNEKIPVSGKPSKQHKHADRKDIKKKNKNNNKYIIYVVFETENTDDDWPFYACAVCQTWTRNPVCFSFGRTNTRRGTEWNRLFYYRLTARACRTDPSQRFVRKFNATPTTVYQPPRPLFEYNWSRKITRRERHTSDAELAAGLYIYIYVCILCDGTNFSERSPLWKRYARGRSTCHFIPPQGRRDDITERRIRYDNIRVQQIAARNPIRLMLPVHTRNVKTAALRDNVVVCMLYTQELTALTISSTGSSNISDPSSCSPSARCWHSANGGGGVDDRLELLLLWNVKRNCYYYYYYYYH